MFKKVAIFLSSAGILAISLIFAARVNGKVRNFVNYSPCYEPIGYKIGSIDERFNITKGELIKDLDEATSIWSNTYGAELFTYDPDAVLTVNLSYDRRQELNTQIDELDNELKQQKNNLDPKLEEYRRRGETFSARLSEFNSEVQKWNSQGGAPQEEYDKLIQEQDSLKKEAEELNAIARELGQSTEQYNDSVARLNQTVNNYGEVIEGKPEEGLYEKIGKEETITIYLHTSQTEFIHTLAHEFGHALRMDHVNDPNSIMFLKTNEVITPSKEDVAQLAEVCRERLVTEVVFDHYSRVFEYLAGKVRLSN